MVKFAAGLVLGVLLGIFLVRFFPMVAVAEVKGVLPEADPHAGGHAHGGHAPAGHAPAATRPAEA